MKSNARLKRLTLLGFQVASQFYFGWYVEHFDMAFDECRTLRQPPSSLLHSSQELRLVFGVFEERVSAGTSVPGAP
jgi:hypothetical protein